MPVTPERVKKPGQTYRNSWENLTTADPDGESVSSPGASDRSVHVIANTAGGATLVVEGSNEDVPTNWVTLVDTFDQPMEFTGTDARTVNANMLHMRARLSVVGAGADWTVLMLNRSTMS